jgi:hypothetical protein
MAIRGYKFPPWLRGEDESGYWVWLELDDAIDQIVFTLPPKKGQVFFQVAVFKRVSDKTSGTRFEEFERRTATVVEVTDYYERRLRVK